MLDVIIALSPTMIFGFVYFGWRALMITAISVASCVLTEFVYEKLMKLPVTVGDLSAVVLVNVFLEELVWIRPWIDDYARFAFFTDDVDVANVIVANVEFLNFHKKNKA